MHAIDLLLVMKNVLCQIKEEKVAAVVFWQPYLFHKTLLSVHSLNTSGMLEKVRHSAMDGTPHSASQRSTWTLMLLPLLKLKVVWSQHHRTFNLSWIMLMVLEKLTRSQMSKMFKDGPMHGEQRWTLLMPWWKMLSAQTPRLLELVLLPSPLPLLSCDMQQHPNEIKRKVFETVSYDETEISNTLKLAKWYIYIQILRILISISLKYPHYQIWQSFFSIYLIAVPMHQFCNNFDEIIYKFFILYLIIPLLK